MDDQTAGGVRILHDGVDFGLFNLKPATPIGYPEAGNYAGRGRTKVPVAFGTRSSVRATASMLTGP